MIQSLFPSYPINQCIRATYKCTPQAPLDTHLRDKYLVTQSITAPRQRGGQAKTSGHQRLISHQRANNCFSWSESYSNSKAHSLCMSGFITNKSISGSSRSQLSQILAVCHGKSRWWMFKTFYHSFFRLCAPSYLELVANHLAHHLPRPWGILLLSHRHCRGGRQKCYKNILYWPCLLVRLL